MVTKPSAILRPEIATLIAFPALLFTNTNVVYERLGAKLLERQLYRQFAGRVKVGFGWGTKLTNDFADLTSENRLAPFALVCKAVAADGRPTVKLSDNVNKSTGPQSEVDRYKRVFEMHDQKADPVLI